MKYSNSLISALLIGSGLFNLVAPALSAELPTKAGNSIDNTANATYEDPAGLPINATSNPVTVVVAVVAGIDVAASGIVDSTPDSIKVGDTLTYNYTITNIGNDKTDIHIPANPTITGPGTLTQVEYLNPVDGKWTPVPVGGVTVSNVLAGATVPVRVVLVVNNDGTNNNVIKVQLGDTPNDAPNQPLSADGKNGDINTSGGTPANGQRESSATQETSVGSVVKNMALATVTEKLLAPNNGVPSNLKDDVLTYQLGLNVAQTDVTNSGITPAPLAGTPINLVIGAAPASLVDRILVSSAIPVGTNLSAPATAPTGWIAVYTTDPTTTNANAANWTTVAPTTAAGLGLVTRVGFVNDPTLSKVVAPGDSVQGFTFSVITDDLTPAQVLANKYSIDSIAQLFGITDGSATPATGTTAAVPGTIIYDESGDKMPNNWEAGSALLDPIVSSFTATMPSANGIADPAAYGKDAGDNSGTGPAGEVNQYVYGYVAPAAISLLNGPKDVPGAVGADATTATDFTDKSSTVPAGKGPDEAFDPAPVGFFNTVQNTGTAVEDIKLAPAFTQAADLPIGTTIRIYTEGAASQSAIYKVVAGGIEFVSGSASGGATAPTATSPVTLTDLAPGAKGQYQVEVDLPLSNDPLTKTTPAQDFPVAINAFTEGVIGTAAIMAFTTAPTSTNITTDKVYTGFIKMTKETRILQGSGPAVATGDTFSTTEKKPAPGNIIEYRITYENIADKAAGSGNVVLSANKLVITEDGTTTTNTWGQDKDSNGKIDTSNVVGSAIGATGSTVSLFSGTAGTVGSTDKTGMTADADVTKYINALTTVVAPGDTGTFTFQRKLN